jgi:hypothetical protein
MSAVGSEPLAAFRSLAKEALAADEEIERTGEVYRADDVHAWVERLARGQDAARAKSWRR